jgi:hypothetical protein
LRVAGAIVLETVAFVIWNLASRTPLALLRDARRAFADPRLFVTGALAAVIGTIFLGAAIVLVFPALTDPAAEFPAVELGSLLVALALEFLIGDDIRTLLGGSQRTR